MSSFNKLQTYLRVCDDRSNPSRHWTKPVIILTAARIWLGHFFASGMVRFALVVLARSHRPRWLRMSVLVWSRANFLRWSSLCLPRVDGVMFVQETAHEHEPFLRSIKEASTGGKFVLRGSTATFRVCLVEDGHSRSSFLVDHDAEFDASAFRVQELDAFHFKLEFQGSLLAHKVRSNYFWLCHVAILEVL